MPITVRGPEVPKFVRGSVVVQRRRCGKPNCHCATGEALHESDGAQLLRGGPDTGRDAARRGGRAGAKSGGALPGGSTGLGGPSQRRVGQNSGGLGRQEVAPTADEDGSGRSRQLVEALIEWLGDAPAAAMTHAELEDRLSTDMREAVRQLYQDHLDLRSQREERLKAVASATGAVHGAVEAGHERSLATVFGEVRVRRMAYRARGQANLCPADAALNLPEERYSHGLRRMAAEEASPGSFDEAAAAIEPGQRPARAQAPGRGADEAFRGGLRGLLRPRQAGRGGRPRRGRDLRRRQGTVMRPAALRPVTAARASSKKLAARLSKGETRYRKRMAEVGAVCDVVPVPRRPEDVMGPGELAAPVAKAKWLTASVVDDAVHVLAMIFDEADRRDPGHQGTWVALVDGANYQINRIKAEAKVRKVEVAIICDFVHVLEYIWKAAWSLFDQGGTGAEAWVKQKALEVLRSKATTVAAAIRRKATCMGLGAKERANADTGADYLLHKAPYLDYANALQKRWPIATGVIEGACRHIVKDRMDITGARWGLDGAEAVLKLRALRSNGDFPSYWAYHLAQERHRVHESRYAHGVIPRAA